MGPRVGIVGGGQLGRMLALAAAPLDIRCTALDPSPDACAGIAAELITADFDDRSALAKLAAVSDVVTFEFENVPAPAIEDIAGRAMLAPSPAALAVSQDRLDEKQMFERLGIATAPHAAVDSPASLAEAAEQTGLPAILKTRRLGYDGKGQAAIATPADFDAAWNAVGGEPSILEGRVDFQRELSVVSVRSTDGETAFYPLTENCHRDGILRESRAPAIVSPETTQLARRYATALLNEFGYIGVLALELFEIDGELFANEFAPRVHNSGHWTIDGAPASQFENHIRALLGLPLGETSPPFPTAMLNLIGGAPPAEEILSVPGAHLHLYGKEARPGRKIGHINVVRENDADLDAALAMLRPLVEQSER
jgi:5-(carboxyamino)imidazole ribonucleotide synthase